MKWGLLLCPCLLLLLLGCAHVREDFAQGLSLPLAQGELTPTEQAAQVAHPLKALPYGTLLFPLVVACLTPWFIWWRGHEARLASHGAITEGGTMTGSWVTRFLRGELGWKTMAGALLILLAVVFQAMGKPEWAEIVQRVGEGVGLIGLRDAVAKLPK